MHRTSLGPVPWGVYQNEQLPGTRVNGQVHHRSPNLLLVPNRKFNSDPTVDRAVH